MKKSVLLACLCGVAALSSSGFEAPTVYPNASWQGISPDGRYVVSNLYSSMTIIDRTTGKEYSYEESDAHSYYTGIGNIVSNTGIVLASNSAHYNASYWENGEWKEAPVFNPELTNSLNGITPDGSRIAGNIGGAKIDLEASATMQLPAYWDRNADGTYTCHRLPHPDLDFLNRVPQYITATSISDDGKVIVGQIVDYSGFFNIPIVYTEGEDGEWTYSSPLQDIFTIEGEIPTDPGDGPTPPTASDYMTDEEKAAYQAALEQWAADGWDYTTYPNEEDYLGEEGKAAYEAAMNQYNADHAAWYEKFEVFQEFFENLQEKLPAFVFNDTRLSPDGTKVTEVCKQVDDSDPLAWRPQITYVTWFIDIATGEVEKLSTDGSLCVTQILPDYTCLAHNGIGSLPATGYIIKNGEVTKVYDYLCSLNPELSQWCEENLKHEVESFDWETGETSFDEYIFTGMTLASYDMDTLVFWTTSNWDWSYETWGYMADSASLSSIKAVEAPAAGQILFDAAGNLVTSEDFTAVSVYDLSGRIVLRNGENSSALAPGVYIVRAQRNDGTAVAAKLRK